MNLHFKINMPDHWILLIDPFKNLINSYRMVLEEEKYSVETSLTLEEAYRLFQLRQYPIIITEYIPPFEATDEMIQWVKKISPETYIIMVTNAAIDGMTYEKLFDIGLDDIILKPYAPEKILVHIKKGLKQRDLILKKQELERESILDQIGRQLEEYIFNSIYFKKCLKQELKRARRHRHHVSLLLITLPEKETIGEGFENFCMELAKIFRKYTREEDLVGRQNGNFGILLPDTDHIGSQALVKRLSNLIQTSPSFQSDEALMPAIQTLSFQSFTYPEQFVIPEPLKGVVEEIDKEKSFH